MLSELRYLCPKSYEVTLFQLFDLFQLFIFVTLLISQTHAYMVLLDLNLHDICL